MIKLPLTPKMKKRLRQVGGTALFLTLFTAQAATIFRYLAEEQGATAAMSVPNETPYLEEAIPEADLKLDVTRVDDSLVIRDAYPVVTESPTSTGTPPAPVATNSIDRNDSSGRAPASLKDRIYGLGGATPFGMSQGSIPITPVSEEVAGKRPADAAVAAVTDVTTTAESSEMGLTVTPVPEPTSAVLMMCGLAAFAFARRRSS